MRITQLSLAGRGAWPDLLIEQIHPRLNVFFGEPGSGKSTVAQLATHLLYGKITSGWRQQFGQSVPLLDGGLVVDGHLGSFALRRQLNVDRTSRLTVAAVDGGAADSSTVQKLLGDISPQVLAQLMAVDFAEAPSVEWLLSRNFTRELSKSPGNDREIDSDNYCAARPKRETAGDVDRLRVEELIRQRNLVTEAIEKQLTVRRQEGHVLSSELKDVVAQLETQRRQRDAIQSDALIVAREIAECEVRLRYVSLETAITSHVKTRQLDAKGQELKLLEGEISGCRKALNDLQAREATLRAEIAQLAPDGTAGRIGNLLDSRSTLNVLEMLVDDLDAEVALLARAHEPGRCTGHDSHAKLAPVATMLRQQVYSLCGLVTEQERSQRRQQLVTEARQISRAQLNLGERLEHLLECRELLVHELSSAGQQTLLRPQSPAIEHCCCEHHGEFVTHADPLLVGYSPRHPQEADLRTKHAGLVQRQEGLRDQTVRLTKELAALEDRWQRLQQERAGLVGSGSLEDLRLQLEQLESNIRGALTPARVTPAEPSATWRASDILSQLTGGKLVQIRLERDDQRPIVVNHAGQALNLAELSTAAHDQLYLALMLALAGSFSRRGVHLPLVLDEPFLRQDSAGSGAMAGLLAEFARDGHQVLVFTEDLDALRRFQALDAQVFDLARARRAERHEQATKQTTFTRVVRETEDGERTPVLQFRTKDAMRDPHTFLTEESLLAEFPVLGRATTEAFGKLGFSTVGQLLAGDATAIARQLDLEQITGSTVALWQSHMRLMCSVPGVTLNDAQVLSACGIRSLDDLLAAVPVELEATIRDFLRSDRGARFASSIARFNAPQIREWADTGSLSQHASPEFWEEDRPVATESSGPKLRALSSEHEAPEFFLNRVSHVANAPSISPHTAQQLASVGIRTVADLLDADPEMVAAQIGEGKTTGEAIAAWQRQSQLVCQIPDLRGYAAQLLVACGFTSPQEIADARLADLVRTVQEFCASKPGQRILRGHEIPSASKIKSWAQNAARHRPLEAA